MNILTQYVDNIFEIFSKNTPHFSNKNVSNQNKKIFCPAPYKIKSTDVDVDYGLVSMGCAEGQKKEESILDPPMEGTSDTLDKP